VVICLGVVPFGVDHPQVARLGTALARSGFSALLYWSPAMRDMRLDPEDIENLTLAYEWFIDQPYIDPTRSGLLGTCVGGSFALMAAASPSIRDRVAFVGTYAPYFSLWTFVHDIASSSTSNGEGQEHWQVDPLTRRVFVRTLTSALSLNQSSGRNTVDPLEVATAVHPLLANPDAEEAEKALQELPAILQVQLSIMSPTNYLSDIHAPLIVIIHDRGDRVVPVGESRHLVAALSGHPRVYYTELRFQHLDPSKLSKLALIRELCKLYLTMYRLFRQIS
jgi:hypothetical protein